MRLPDYEKYKEEKEKWEQAGSPLRSPARIREIYNICKDCPNYIPIMKGVGQCSICTCLLREKGKHLNKIAFATTRCPLEEPKWIEEAPPEPEVTKVQYIHRPPSPPRTGGCGCGN